MHFRIMAVILQIFVVLTLAWTITGLEDCVNCQNEDSNGNSGKACCITTQDDPGALRMKEFNKAVHEAECELVNNTIYTDYDIGDDEIFDYVIVGGGTAGCIVGNRLSENHEIKVLILEAGGDPTLTTEFPNLWGETVNSELDWKYRSEPEPTNCLGLVNQRCAFPRGKVLGGCSSINGMLYIRGNPLDYQAWELNGNPGWGYESMLPYFKKSEDMRSEVVLRNKDFSKYHGKGGYFKIESYKNDIDFFIKSFTESAKELGFKFFDDVNAGHNEGLFNLQGHLDKGRRCSTAKAFLHGFQTRPNLKISKKSLVTKILIDEHKIAFGVEFIKAGKHLRVTASKEVIISAGVINSPQLLMLSGIGPENHLKEFGIEVVQDLRVGENFQDHTISRGFVFTIDRTVPPTDAKENMFQFLINSKGELSGTGTSRLSLFIKTSKALYPNIQFYYAVFPANSSSTLKTFLTTQGIIDATQRSIISKNLERFTIFMAPSLLRPKSRGKILLRSQSPQDYPLIFPGFFSNEEDVEEVLEAIHFAKIFIQTQAMKELNATLEHVVFPGCESLEFQTDPYWRCVIKHISTTINHAAGTCKMGPAKESDSVVDPSLKVIGIDRLRVIDASVMSSTVSGNIIAATIAIAEKGSDMIKETWKDL